MQNEIAMEQAIELINQGQGRFIEFITRDDTESWFPWLDVGFNKNQIKIRGFENTELLDTFIQSLPSSKWSFEMYNNYALLKPIKQEG